MILLQLNCAKSKIVNRESIGDGSIIVYAKQNIRKKSNRLKRAVFLKVEWPNENNKKEGMYGGNMASNTINPTCHSHSRGFIFHGRIGHMRLSFDVLP